MSIWMQFCRFDSMHNGSRLCFNDLLGLWVITSKMRERNSRNLRNISTREY